MLWGLRSCGDRVDLAVPVVILFSVSGPSSLRLNAPRGEYSYHLAIRFKLHHQPFIG